MFGRRDLKAALHMRTMVDPNIKPGHRQPLIGNPLPLLAKIAKLHVGRRQIIRQQPFVFALKIGLVA